MKTLLEMITIEMKEAFKAAGYDEELARVTLSNRPDLCEYQCNGAMAGAKKYKKAPIMIANAVVEELADSKYFASAEAVNPGFINLKLAPEVVAEYLNEMAADENLGVEKEKNPKKVIIDYGGPNVAKPLHVGHLRSAIIGESIKRIIRFKGNDVTGDIHLGDWGYQMGLIITELKNVNRNSRILMRVLKENIRKKHHLRSVNWKRFILQQVLMQKSTTIIEKKHFMQLICYRMDIKDIVQSGNIS